MDRRAAGDATGSIIYVIGALAAIAALVVPFALWARSQPDADRSGFVAQDPIREHAELVLAESAVAAERHFAEHGSYAGLTPEAASALAPGITFNASPVAIPGEVSIRAALPTSVVLATRSDDGRPFCAVASIDGVTFGEADPPTATGCLPSD